MFWRLSFTLLLLGVTQPGSSAPTDQKPLLSEPAAVDRGQTEESLAGGRRLHGRFLHITDFHPDPFYKPFSSTDSDDACHSGTGEAGVFGAERSDCDSPISLVNATFQWLNDNLKDSIDFIVWTGDSARHDNDEALPRTEDQVVEMNSFLVDKFVEVFGKDDNINDTDPTNDLIIPIVPNFGNNDILPHNIFTKGPNRWTRRFSHVWRKFIPEEQKHGFERGGWFFVEVIPQKLAVFSLNTLYFFDNNAAVDGCARRSEPGYEQMEWLRIQLEFVRERGMKAIMMGHVPPARTESKQSWDETCWQKYTLWMQQYRDVVVGSLFGHMNIEHFMLQDFDEIDMKVITGEVKPRKQVKLQSAADYLTELRYGWSNLPKSIPGVNDDSNSASSIKASKSKKDTKKERSYKKIGGKWGERYAASLVTASVVPNYFPTLRVIEYNSTGLGAQASLASERLEIRRNKEVELDGLETRVAKEEDTSKRYKKKPKFIVPNPPSKAAPPGPAYSPQPLSWTGYTQYYANLTQINAAFNSSIEASKDLFNYKTEYDTKNDRIFGLEDLTVRSFIGLASRIGQYEPSKDVTSAHEDFDSGDDTEGSGDLSTYKKKKHKKHRKRKRMNKVWYTFIKRAFVSAKDEKELKDQFS